MTGKTARNFAWLVIAQTDNEDNRHFICDVDDSAEALKLCGFNQNGESPYITETDAARPARGLLHVYQNDDGECSSCLEDPQLNSPWSIQVIRRDMVNEPIEKLLKSSMDFHTLYSVDDINQYVKDGPRDLESSTVTATELANSIAAPKHKNSQSTPSKSTVKGTNMATPSKSIAKQIGENMAQNATQGMVITACNKAAEIGSSELGALAGSFDNPFVASAVRSVLESKVGKTGVEMLLGVGIPLMAHMIPEGTPRRLALTAANTFQQQAFSTMFTTVYDKVAAPLVRHFIEAAKALPEGWEGDTAPASLSEGVAANATTAATRVTVKAKARAR